MNKNILIVDDDKHTQELIKYFLEEEGYSVKVAPDGYSALQEVKINYYDLIILDISMPFMNGFKVIRKMQNNKLIDDTPILMLTGSNYKSDVTKALMLNVVDYVIKPAKRSDLISRVDKIFKEQPKFKEVSFNNTDSLDTKGKFLADFKLEHIGSGGMILKGNLFLAENTVLTKLRLGIFDDIGLNQRCFEITRCEKKDNTYLYYISFQSLNGQDTQKLNAWLAQNQCVA